MNVDGFGGFGILAQMVTVPAWESAEVSFMLLIENYCDGTSVDYYAIGYTCDDDDILFDNQIIINSTNYTEYSSYTNVKMTLPPWNGTPCKFTIMVHNSAEETSGGYCTSPELGAYGTVFSMDDVSIKVAGCDED